MGLFASNGSLLIAATEDGKIELRGCCCPESTESIESSVSIPESISTSDHEGGSGGSGSGSGVEPSASQHDSHSGSQHGSESVSESKSQSYSLSMSDGDGGFSSGSIVESSESSSKSSSNLSSESSSQSSSKSSSQPISGSSSQSSSQSSSESQSISESVSISISESQSESKSISQSQSVSESQSISESKSESQSESKSISQSQSVSESQSISESKSISQSQSVSESQSISESKSESISISESISESESKSESISESISQSQSASESTPQSTSKSHHDSHSESKSESQGLVPCKPGDFDCWELISVSDESEGASWCEWTVDTSGAIPEGCSKSTPESQVGYYADGVLIHITGTSGNAPSEDDCHAQDGGGCKCKCIGEIYGTEDMGVSVGEEQPDGTKTIVYFRDPCERNGGKDKYNVKVTFVFKRCSSKGVLSRPVSLSGWKLTGYYRSVLDDDVILSVTREPDGENSVYKRISPIIQTAMYIPDIKITGDKSRYCMKFLELYWYDSNGIETNQVDAKTCDVIYSISDISGNIVQICSFNFSKYE